jgi:hypothetical protein
MCQPVVEAFFFLPNLDLPKRWGRNGLFLVLKVIVATRLWTFAGHSKSPEPHCTVQSRSEITASIRAQDVLA